MKRFFKGLLILIMLLSILPALVFGWLLAEDHIFPKVAAYNARSYLDDRFPGNDFVIERSYYDFKSDSIGVGVQSASSRDTHFQLWYNATGTQLEYDTFSIVEERRTTLSRLRDEYEVLVRAALTADVPELNWVMCDLIEYYEEDYSEHFNPTGIRTETLQLDGEYDPAEIGRRYGEIDLSFDVSAEELTLQTAAEYLLEADRLLQKFGLPYRYIGIDLYYYENEQYVDSLSLSGIPPEELSGEDPISNLNSRYEEYQSNRGAEKEPQIEMNEEDE